MSGLGGGSGPGPLGGTGEEIGGAVIYTCVCCGYRRSFAGGSVGRESLAKYAAARVRAHSFGIYPPPARLGEVEAFDAGWDTPSWFAVAPICTACGTLDLMELAPGSGLLVPTRRPHRAQHLKWATSGRHPEGGRYGPQDVLPPMPDKEVEAVFEELRRRAQEGAEGKVSVRLDPPPRASS